MEEMAAGTCGKPSATLSTRGDLSTFESEILIDALDEVFALTINSSQIRDEDPFVTEVSLALFVRFDEFFALCGPKRWARIKDIFKEAKRRRGSRGFGFTIEFSGTRPTISFRYGSKRDEMIESSLEQLIYLTDMVAFQADGSRLPKDVSKVNYAFDESSRRWFPLSALGEQEGTVYSYDSRNLTWERFESSNIV